MVFYFLENGKHGKINNLTGYKDFCLEITDSMVDKWLFLKTNLSSNAVY
jgi:hypothetical protein